MKKEFYLDFCETCFSMTNHIDDVCQKCKPKPKFDKDLGESIQFESSQLVKIKPKDEGRRRKNT